MRDRGVPFVMVSKGKAPDTAHMIVPNAASAHPIFRLTLRIQ
jgi:hypothetical protein